jgi:hypothetical protein
MNAVSREWLVRTAHPTCNQVELSLLAQSSAWDGQVLVAVGRLGFYPGLAAGPG